MAVVLASETTGDSPSIGSGSRFRRPKLSGLTVLLGGVLGAQAALSIPLMTTNTAFVDEADYLRAGREMVRNGLSPLGYEEYFSGSPKLYPLLATVFDSMGGLFLARMLSLAFMLGTTLLIYGTARRLFTPTAGVFAAGTFAVLGPTLFLGAFATYDAMAVFLLAWSLWCVVRSSVRAIPDEKFFLAAAALLLLANMTKYATLLYDPVVVAVAVVVFARHHSWRLAIRRGLFIAGIVLGLGFLFLLGAGPSYWRGLFTTTLLRPSGTDSTAVIVHNVGLWIGLLLAVSVAGLLVCSIRFWRSDRLTGALLVVLTIALVLAPANQLRIHTLASLNKHVDFGAMFGAIAVGYLLSLVSGQRLRAAYRYVLPVGLIVLIGYLGTGQSRTLYQAWSNSTQFTNTISTLTRPGREHYLVEDADIAAYYANPDIDRTQWSGTIAFQYDDPATPREGKLHDDAAWVRAIQNHYFSVIELSNSSNPEADALIRQTIATTPGYKLVAKIANHGSYGLGYYWIWKTV